MGAVAKRCICYTLQPHADAKGEPKDCAQMLAALKGSVLQNFKLLPATNIMLELSTDKQRARSWPWPRHHPRRAAFLHVGNLWAVEQYLSAAEGTRAARGLRGLDL